MAITHDNFSLATYAADVTSLTWTHTNTAGDLIAVSAFARDSAGINNENVASVTYNGVSLTKIRQDRETVRNQGSQSIWYLKTPATGSHNVVVTFSGNVHYFGGAFAETLIGVDQTNPVDAQSGAESATNSITTLTNGAAIFDIFSSDDGSGAPVMGAETNRVSRETHNEAGYWALGVSTLINKTTAGAQTMDWTTAISIPLSTIVSFTPAAVATLLPASVM